MHQLMYRERCPSCASTSTQSLLRHPYDAPPVRNFLESHYGGRADLTRLTGASFEVDGCHACGLVFQKAIPSDPLLEEIYDSWIPPSERARLQQRHDLACYRYWAMQVEFVIQYFNVKPWQLSFFDFGIGWAEWAHMARGYGCAVAGAELSSARAEYARSIGIEIIDWDDIPNHRFHFINTEQVFEHLVEPRDTLKHLVRAMHPNGLIKISVPKGRGIRRRLQRLPGMNSVSREFLMPIQPLEHINCFDYRSLVELGRQAGLKPVRPRLRLMYNAASGWFEPRQALTNLLRPIYRHVYPKSTVMYFCKSA